jgi:opacity protein-like surface antigen
MKRIALAAAMTIALAGVAKADWVDWVAVGAGGTQSPDLGYGGTEFEMDYGYHGTAMVGWNQSEEISIAADVMFAESEYNGFSSSLQSLSVMLDAIYTCDTGSFWHPYIGVGAGAINLRYEGGNMFPAFTGSEWAFGYQGMTGVSFDIDDKHAIFVGYRYQQSEDVTIKGVSDIEYASHNITIGVLFD